MTTMLHVKARITPWDDRAFVAAYEHARKEADRVGCTIDGPDAAACVERLLREAGFLDARVEIRRSVEEALQHVAHWDVRRDG